MKKLISSLRWAASALCAVLLLMGTLAAPGIAQEGHQKTEPADTADVEHAKMGPYRALAHLTYQAFQKGDYHQAALLAHILETTWDKGELSGGANALPKFNGTVFFQADSALDEFILPIMAYDNGKAADAASVEAAYTNFLEKLKEADSAPQIPVPHAIHLSSEALQTFVGEFQVAPPAGKNPEPPVKITADQEGLWVHMEHDEKFRLRAFSLTEFFAEDFPSVHTSFTKNAHGQVTGFIITGWDPVPMKATKLP